jgi:hypothetical protein
MNLRAGWLVVIIRLDARHKQRWLSLVVAVAFAATPRWTRGGVGRYLTNKANYGFAELPDRLAGS